MIIETSGGQLFRVRDAADASLAHVWIGIEVRRAGAAFTPKAKAREILVRKAASRIVKEAE